MRFTDNACFLLRAWTMGHVESFGGSFGPGGNDEKAFAQAPASCAFAVFGGRAPSGNLRRKSDTGGLPVQTDDRITIPSRN